jgi:hypothetical protein
MHPNAARSFNLPEEFSVKRPDFQTAETVLPDAQGGFPRVTSAASLSWAILHNVEATVPFPRKHSVPFNSWAPSQRAWRVTGLGPVSRTKLFSRVNHNLILESPVVNLGSFSKPTEENQAVGGKWLLLHHPSLCVPQD